MAHPLEAEFYDRYWQQKDRGMSSYDAELRQIIQKFFGISPVALDRLPPEEQNRLIRTASRYITASTHGPEVYTAPQEDMDLIGWMERSKRGRAVADQGIASLSKSPNPHREEPYIPGVFKNGR
jgi:hypothetical protein